MTTTATGIVAVARSWACHTAWGGPAPSNIAHHRASRSRTRCFGRSSASDSEEKQGWAEQAKIRANATAAKYNEYFLKNSFIWKDNIPEDIAEELPYIE